MQSPNIIKYGDPILEKTADPIEKIDENVRRHLNDMIQALKSEKCKDVIAIAAPQIGVPLRLIVIRNGSRFQCFINPEIVKTKGTKFKYESCVSVPFDIYGEVERPKCVTIRAMTPSGKMVQFRASGNRARTFCHEIDHLNGILFLQKSSHFINSSFETIKPSLKRMRGAR